MERPPTLKRGSQARLSELLNILIQAGKALHEEYDGIMGPDGQGWDGLLETVFPGSTDTASPGALPSSVDGASARPSRPSTTAHPLVHPEPYTSEPSAASNCSVLPQAPNTASTPTKKPSEIPAAALQFDLSQENRVKEWKLINHFADARAKMTQDQLARAHAAFLHWWGWAPTKEEMQRAREAARASWTLTGLFGPWCSPFTTQVWLKASREQSIAKIRELKVSDWETADSLASVVGVRLKQADRPKNEKNGTTAEETDAIETGIQNGDAKSLIVKLRIKNNNNNLVSGSRQRDSTAELMQDGAYSTNELDQSQPTSQPGTKVLQAELLQSAALPMQPPHMDTCAANIDSTGLNQFQGQNSTTVGSNALTTGQAPDSSTSAEGIVPIPSPGSRLVNWMVNRAASIGRSFMTAPSQEPSSSTNAQVEPSSQSALPSSPAHDVVSGTPTARAVESMDEDNRDNADPSFQLHQEIEMHTPVKGGTQVEEPVKIKQEEREEDHSLASSTPSQHEAPSTTASDTTNSASSPAMNQVAALGFGAQKSDPRVNALIAFLINGWRARHRRNLGTNQAAMEKLADHCSYAIPAIERESAVGEITRGKFTWDGNYVLWHSNLKDIDDMAEVRVQQKLNTESNALNTPSEKTNKANVLNTLSATMSNRNTVSTGSTSSTATIQGKSTPPSSSSEDVAPPKPETKPASSRPPYPDSSIVAISELTPDARANAFAAYLAKKFYKANGIDLMADEEASHKLRMYATRNEYHIRGVVESSAFVPHFWDWKDLKWKITGYQLDVRKVEWVKRFPEPQDSENEDDEQEEECDKTNSENGDGTNKDDEDVEMSDDEDEGDVCIKQGRKSETNSPASATFKQGHRPGTPCSTSSNLLTGSKRRRDDDDHDLPAEDVSNDPDAPSSSDGSDNDFDALPSHRVKKVRLSSPSTPTGRLVSPVVPSSHTLATSSPTTSSSIILAVSPSLSQSFSATPSPLDGAQHVKEQGIVGTCHLDGGRVMDIENDDVDRNLMDFVEEIVDEE